MASIRPIAINDPIIDIIDVAQRIRASPCPGVGCEFESHHYGGWVGLVLLQDELPP